MVFLSTSVWLMSMMIIIPLSSAQTPPPAPSTEPPAPSTQPPPLSTQPPTTAEDHPLCASVDLAQCGDPMTSALCPNLCTAAKDPQVCSFYEAGQCGDPISRQCPNLCTPEEDPQLCSMVEVGQCEKPISKQCPNLCTVEEDHPFCGSVDPALCGEPMTSALCPNLCTAEEDPQVCSIFEVGQCGDPISKQCPNLCTPVEDHFFCIYLEFAKCGEAEISKQCPNMCTAVPAKIDGQWSSWGSWGSCSVTCGGGTKQRRRLCDDPMPDNGGLECEGLATEDENCGTNDCPVDGGWSGWFNWESCSVTCGGGQRQRYRDCTSPTPAHGGQVCPGTDTRVEYNCNPNDCVPRCPTGFTMVGHQCIQFVTQKKSWGSAEGECKWLGGTGLANLEHTDITLVTPLITDGSSPWVGARRYPGVKWQWTSTRTTVTNWNSGQPDARGQDLCIYLSTSYGKYADYYCSNTETFLCEASPVISG